MTAPDTALSEAARRRDLVVTLLFLTGEKGLSLNAAAKEMGESAATLSRYRRAYETGGLDGLVPQQRKSGRKPLAELTDGEWQQVQQLVLQTDPTDGKCKRVNVSLALRLYAQRPECRPELREAILKPRRSKHTITPTLKRQARVRPEEKDRFRGEKTFQLNHLTQPRGLFYIDNQGREQNLVPGICFEGDDMHLNEPFWVEWDDPADPCAAAFGVRAFRAQLIPWLDVGSGRFVAYSMVLRYSDAYRARDLRWSLNHLFQSVGVPEMLRLERGVWDAKIINEIETDARLCRITHATGPKSKFIENRFNSLQKLLSTRGVHVGRRRGEFEEAGKDWIACRQGRLDPRDAGFASLESINESIEWAFHFLNNDPMEGRIYGCSNAQAIHQLPSWVPDDIWSKHIGPDGLRRPTLEEGWRMMPEIREVSIRSGMVQCKGAEYGATYHFHHPDFAKVGRDYRVKVAFDPADPTSGAAILNREPRQGARNREGWPENHLICLAEHVADVPQFSMEAGRYFGGQTKRYTQLCRMLYREIVPFGLARKRRTVDHARDGRGNSAELVQTSSSPRPGHSLPAPTTPRDAAASVRHKRAVASGKAEPDRKRHNFLNHVDY